MRGHGLRGRVLVAAALLSGGCGSRSRPASEVAARDTTTRSAPAPGPFLESGALLDTGAGAGDATQVSSLVAASAPGGDRFVVGLSRADGFPATRVGGVAVEFLRDQRVVRIRLPKEVLATAITDNAFVGTFADRAYVVRGLDDTGLWVDLHLRAAAVARASVQSSPALIVVELQSGGSMLTAWPSVAGNIVVLKPPREGRVSYPLEITGYARTFEANVEAELRQSGVVKARARATAADYASTWGEFRMQIAEGPHGPVELWAGEHSAKDGSAQGVTVSLGVE